MPGTTQLFVLDATGTSPPGTVRVTEWTQEVKGMPTKFADFFIDRYEVTNRQYKKFLDEGGYQRPEFWSALQPVPFQKAIKSFTDQTGLPGPSTWRSGDYVSGQDAYPVSGVSWYEAAAYAKWAGKELPTTYHWLRAYRTGPIDFMLAWILPASNLEGSGPTAVGLRNSVTRFGAFDMAGNVREWTRNAVGDERYILGGGWKDNTYVGLTLSYLSPMNRDETNGFRLAAIHDDLEVMTRASLPVPAPDPRDRKKIEPVSEKVFRAYSDVYAYDQDRIPLKPEIISSEPSRNWRLEKVEINTAYGERMRVNLFLPQNAHAPYQTVVYFPGLTAWSVSSWDQGRVYLDYLIKSGRAVAQPVLRGTFERRDGQGPVGPGTDTLAGREALVKIIQDVRRTVDYLVTRPDVDKESLAFYGLSIGGALAPNVLALEPRFRVAVLDLPGFPSDNLAGFQSRSWREDINPATYLPHVKIPVLQFSGKLDPIFPYETSAKPFFDLLGTQKKELVTVSGGHTFIDSERAPRTLRWLDDQLGPVR